MTHQPAAPSEADAPRPWARAILHAQIPAALKLLLLALLAAFTRGEAARHSLRIPRTDWFISAHTNPNAAPDEEIDWYELRRRRHFRAMLGWILNGTRNKGMRPSGRRAPVLHPAPSARAPPIAVPRPQSP